MPYKIKAKSNLPIYEYHVEMGGGYITPHFNRIDAHVVGLPDGFTIPCRANHTMMLNETLSFTFYPITDGHVYQEKFNVFEEEDD